MGNSLLAFATMEVELSPLPEPLKISAFNGWLSARGLLALWVLSGILLALGIGRAPLERTQEARVLETAREMLHQGFDGWMIPHANGRLRLQKPPLAYWLCAGMYKLAGVSLFAGRLPMALAGWLTLGVVFWMAKWLFSRRAAFFAALALFSSFLFFRFFRLAETDPLSTLFTTAATFFLWRGLQSEVKRNEQLWYHAAAAVLGLALLAKGPQVAFVLFFFICYVAVERKWKCLHRLITSGAPITFIVIGLPWWAYAFMLRGAAQWKSEVEITATGKDHSAWFLVYLPCLLYGVAPWCAFVIGGVVESFRRWRTDWRHRGLLLWIGTILIPLCFVGNKQLHYLIPLMVPLLILAGWLVSEVWVRLEDADFLRAMRWMLFGTLLGCLLIPIAVIVTSEINIHRIQMTDWIVAIAMLAGSITTLEIWRRGTLRQAFITFAAAAVIGIALLIGWWTTTIDGNGWVTMRDYLRSQAAEHPVVYYGNYANLRFSFAMRRVVPVLNNPQDLRAWLKKSPDTLVIVLRMDDRNSPAPPPFLKQQRIIRTKEDKIGLYRGDMAER